MRTSPILAAAAAVCSLTVMTGCDSATTAAQPALPVTEPAPTEVSQPGDIDAAVSGESVAPADALAAAVSATRMVDAAFVRYAATGLDTLTATSWAADVTAAPPAASGSANLLVDGQRSQTDFDVNGGRLLIENVDGVRTDVGDSRGVLDPPELLHRLTGLSALLSAVTGAAVGEGPSDLRGLPMLRLQGTLPAAAARLLVPAELLDGEESLPVSLWLDPARGYTLRQLILTTTSGGAVTVSLDPAT